jgi:hypothetical protein
MDIIKYFYSSIEPWVYILSSVCWALMFVLEHKQVKKLSRMYDQAEWICRDFAYKLNMIQNEGQQDFSSLSDDDLRKLAGRIDGELIMREQADEERKD